MADDLAQWAVGTYGLPVDATPNVDQIAAEGVVFKNAMAVSPVCSPARASFFTGKTPSQHGIHDFLSENPDFDAGWLDGEVLLSERLSALGYRTGLIGKWHATTNSQPPQPGFDRWLSFDPYRSGWQNQYIHDGTVGFSDQGNARDETGVQAEFLTDEAIRFIESSASQPFFLSLNFVEPHEPFAGLPERLVERYRGEVDDLVDVTPVEDLPPYSDANRVPPDHAEKLAQYLAAVTLIDEQVGRLTAAVREAGLLDNTILVVTSDHGMLVGQRGLYGKANATLVPNFYEPTIRVPFVVRGPGVSVQRRSEFVDLIDLNATILDFASGGEVIASPGSRGVSFRQLLADSSNTGWRSFQVIERGVARMITDGEYKLVRYFRRGQPDQFVDYWYAIEAGDDRRLRQRPDVGERLQVALDAYFERYDDPNRSGRFMYQQSPPNARVAREAEEPEPF